ncbi:MAG: carboxypeptidase-like regulatory domain-containing protein [Chloroflexi bacterium]|nr:carboxypeptidase-like regulatory domain-containing protein [Chloroflexota bacterium]
MVLDATGGPQAGVIVFLCRPPSGSCEDATTDIEGRFRVAVPRDDYFIVIQAPVTHEAGFYDSDSPVGLAQDFELAEILRVRAAPVDGIEMMLRSAPDRAQRTVSGRITDSEGMALVDALVRVCPTSKRTCHSVSTDENGDFLFSLDINGEEYELRIEVAGVPSFYSAVDRFVQRLRRSEHNRDGRCWIDQRARNRRPSAEPGRRPDPGDRRLAVGRDDGSRLPRVSH